MTTTLEWWQIGVLILLILTAVVILSRLVTLIALVATHLWSELTQNATSPYVESRHPADLNESGRDITLSDVPAVTLASVAEEPEEPAFLGSTGASPGGVSFDPNMGKFVKEKPAKKRSGSKGFLRRRV